MCTVTEIDNGGADGTPPPVTVTIPDADEAGVVPVVIAGFVNPFSAGQIQVTKQLDGDNASAHTSDVFTLAVTCQYDLDGTLVTVYSGSVQVSGGQTVLVTDTAGDPVLLPPGAHCFAEETDAGGADASSVDYDSYDNAVIVEQGDELGTLTITAVNTFNTPPVRHAPEPVLPAGSGRWWRLGNAVLHRVPGRAVGVDRCRTVRAGRRTGVGHPAAPHRLRPGGRLAIRCTGGDQAIFCGGILNGVTTCTAEKADVGRPDSAPCSCMMT